MAIFPVIKSPCPYRGKLGDILDGDICRLCDRQVHDLTVMSDLQKRAFLQSCSDDTCVSYGIPAALLSASVLAALGVPSPALAQETRQREVITVIGGGMGLVKEIEVLEIGPTNVELSAPAFSLAELAAGPEAASGARKPAAKATPYRSKNRDKRG